MFLLLDAFFLPFIMHRFLLPLIVLSAGFTSLSHSQQPTAPALKLAPQAAGLGLKESAGFHGNALALGTSEVTLADLANAYRLLANGGRRAHLAQARELLDVPAAAALRPARLRA